MLANEPNDVISNANDSGISSDGTRNIVIDSNIDSNNDVDLYQFQANAGEGVVLDIDADELSTGLDPILRLFDEFGNELAVSDDDSAPGEDFSLDSYITFIPNTSANYYVGVSSFSNFNYDPINGNSSNGNSSGNYELGISLVEVQPDDDPDNTIDEAIDSGVSSTEHNTTIIQNSIDFEGDVDVFEFQLDEGDKVSLNINAAQRNSGLDPILRLFDESGNELAVNDDNSAPGESFSLDSYIEFDASSSGKYYVGVSGYADFEYDVLNGSTNLDANTFSSTGDYELVINAFNTIEGTDSRDILQGTQQNDFIRGENGDDILTGLEQNDSLVGGGGDDILTGNNGNDTLIGGDGSDRLIGDRGNDILQGDAGDNFYIGGEGSDIYAVANIDGVNNTIVDFEDGTDKILLQGASFFDATIENSDGLYGTSVSIFGTSVATLVGVDPSNISEDDFVA